MCELLAPVRDEISFVAALEAGANAVYFGIGSLNMRINSKGIEPEMLADIVKRAHAKNVKVYTTLNTIVYDDELEMLDELLDIIKAANTDAVICSDFAVINKAKEKGLPIHISTQANISNIEAVKFYAELGAERVVLARELTLEQIAEIKQKSPIEIETFVHGAMCVSVSGRCFMSQAMFGASANRGDCYQPCRREYTIIDNDSKKQLKIGDGYVLSPKDMCTLPIMKKLINAGIDCFKIEGRSRSPEYIKAVTAAYRQAIDAVKSDTFTKSVRNELMTRLKSVYNRGFSTGFYLGKPGGKDFSKVNGSSATHKKITVGKILHYYPKPAVAFAAIEACPISIGDKIQIQGPTTGVLEFEITDLRTEDEKPVTTLNKTRGTFPCPRKVRTSDRLFKVIKN